jgi:serine/arginine repetitive matrix protein 1
MTVQSVDVVVEEDSVATIAGAEVEVGVETLIVEYRDVVRVRRRTYTHLVKKNAILTRIGEEGLHRLVVREIHMSLVVIEVAAVEAAVATGLVSVAAPHQAVVPLLHHLVAFDAHPLQVAHELRRGDVEDRHPPIALDHRLAVHDDVPRPLTRCPQSHDGEETSLGPRAMIAEGYRGISRALLPHRKRTSQAHHRPDCLDRAHGRRRVVAEDLPVAHAVPSESADAGALRPKPTHTDRELT